MPDVSFADASAPRCPTSFVPMAKKLGLLALIPVATAALLLSSCTSDKEQQAQRSTTTAESAPASDTTTSVTGADASTTTDSDTTGGAATGDTADDGCYVHLFDEDHFDERDRNFRLTQPGKYADLRNLPGADHDWTDEADSIRVGPTATVTIWPRTNFEGQAQTLEPGSEHADLHDEPQSLELAC